MWEQHGWPVWSGFLCAPFSASLGLVDRSSLLLNLATAPLIIAGVLGGKWILHRINQAVFEWLMIIFSILGALKLALG